MLEIALYNFVLNKLYSKSYTPLLTPPMLRREILGKSVSLEDFEEVIYKIENEDLYLIGTSEHTIAALHENETLNYKQLPIKYAGLSPCFRKEAGVTKDSKGIFRVHNFNKIEQFIFCKPQDSDKYHKELIENAEEIFKELEIHYRVVDICSGDIGSMATRKYDIEAWLPGQEKYREMVSASNYRDYGARR
ncbi:serine--tRNA ligase, partial [bacterium]|nr:serine--tRNA ligase [bacterium]